MATIGSAVGLGNIWRFPYVAYQNGGGAFLIPYLCALLTAGIPMLMLEYSLGHRYRGSGPLAFRRISKWGEFAGWFQVFVAFLIALYYPIIIAWAVRYVGYSFRQEWGDDPARFFNNSFLHKTDGFGLHMVPNLLIPLLLVWGVIGIVMVLGVENGIGRLNRVFVPVLVILFACLVIRALFLPGATEGLNVFFTPKWESLLHPAVWIAAYGQIFFSLNVGFAVMITYSSYLKRKTNLVGTGYMVAFANSSFEALAGIGVFATLGFLAVSSGQQVGDVAEGGISLAFIAFPTIISHMPGGTVFGVVFFGCLAIAGLTSQISVVEVCIAAIRDKFGLARWAAATAVILPLLIASILLFPTSTGSSTLDIFDKFVCSIGIVSAAIVAMMTISWGLHHLPILQTHLNALSSRRVGWPWRFCVSLLTPAVLLIILATEVHSIITEGYGNYPQWALLAFGWLPILCFFIISLLLPLVPWPAAADVDKGAVRRPEEDCVQRCHGETHGGENAVTQDPPA
ncbi:MAG: sodium-dependent transporter [Corynebacteriales bacterium]|nr:sodium-dependent transporter [Mycobacteriales bacterium]